MSLDTTLSDITARLHENGFPNEQAISQGIVLRVLRELDWDTYDVNVVWPEYKTGGRRADFALCHPPSRPAIFIEVKQVGLAEGAVRQALEYAFHAGVPFVVLTDGRTWSFYLPAEQGDYDERRVYKLDLYERSPGEAAEALRRYLTHDHVASGKALEAARTEYRNRNRRSEARRAIADAWRELVHKRDGRLIEILADAVESKVGFPPDGEDVVAFLGGAVPIARLDGRARRPSSGPGSAGATATGSVETPPASGRNRIDEATFRKGLAEQAELVLLPAVRARAGSGAPDPLGIEGLQSQR